MSIAEKINPAPAATGNGEMQKRLIENSYRIVSVGSTRLEIRNAYRRKARATGTLKLGRVILATMQRRQAFPELSPIEQLSRLRVAEIELIIKHRHGVIVPDARGTDDLSLCLAYVKVVAGSLGEIDGWTRRWLPWMDDAAVISEARGIAARLVRSKKGPSLWSADAVAKALCVTFSERQALGLKTIGACDISREERTQLAQERKRELDRERQRAKRMMQGRKTRAEYEAGSAKQNRPWEAAGVSRATWYRNRKKESETGRSRIVLDKTAGDTLVSRVPNEAANVPAMRRINPIAPVHNPIPFPQKTSRTPRAERAGRVWGIIPQRGVPGGLAPTALTSVTPHQHLHAIGA